MLELRIVPTTPFCSNHRSHIMYHPLFILAIERLISSFSLVVTIVLRLSSRASTPHFSFIFYDHFCSEHRAPRHLAPNIHVRTSFMLRTSSATTLGCDHSYFSYHSCYVHRAPCHLAPNIHVLSSLTLRTLLIASCYFALTSS